ncbi:MAG: SpoIIE family protein phosphatase [Eubacterium sp.]|jgi:stage II sporulation protein E|nr:SpoIIE family protein phosphatase [Eubacterium sp.]
MKRTGWKQLAVSIVGALLCKVSIMGCYPFVPAYFAAVYLQERARWLLPMGMLAGMAAFIPITAIAKYAMSMLIIVITVRLSEWVDKRCYTVAAAVAASGGTLALSVFGGVFDLRNQVTILSAVLEAIFIFGFCILAARGVHLFFEEKEQQAGYPAGTGSQKEQRLLNYAKSFEGLSKTFLAMDRQVKIGQEDVGQIQQEIAGRICSGCDTCAICWAPANHTMYGVFEHLVNSLMKNGEADEKARKELQKHCCYAGHVEQEAVSVFEQVRVNKAWYNRLLENREVIAQQLDAMAYIMQDCANEAKLLDREERRLLSEIRYRAKEYGIIAEEIHLYQKNDGHIQAELKVRSRWGNCVAMKDLTKAVAGALDLHMKPHKDTRTFIGKETSEVIYEEEPAFHAVHGVARLTKDGASISGDNFSCMEKEDGELVLSLSDGMGFGARACKESEMVVDLLERFIEAGFTKETAIKMLNSAMVIHGEDEQYSTVDIASVNLYTGETAFYKIGASATFIRHKDGSVECLLSTSLPVGVSFEIEIEQAVKQLSDGDFLVMITDGVLEYLQTDSPEEMLEDMIAGIQTNHPGLLAKKLLDQVMVYTGGEVRDDMTVLAAALWES